MQSYCTTSSPQRNSRVRPGVSADWPAILANALPVDLLLPRLHRVIKRSDHQWSACCPAHPDSRPSLFVFSTANCENDANAGRGSGKTTVAQTIGKIAGGCLTLQRDSDFKQKLSDLLSPEGMGIRMLLMDNVKSLKFSSALVESLVTIDEIDGHVLFKGHGKRPNYLTSVMTMNEPMLSTDFATRSIPVMINQSKKNSDWDARLEWMLSNREFLDELYADILWHLQQPGKSDLVEDGSDRWSMWWKQVVSPIGTDAEELYQAREEVKQRRRGVDADLSSRELIEEVLRNVMVTNGISAPDRMPVYFPTIVLQKMLADILGRNCNLSEVGQRINAMKPQNLYYRKSGPDGTPRGYWWLGEECDSNANRGIGFKFVDTPGSPFPGYQKHAIQSQAAVRHALCEARGRSEAELRGAFLGDVKSDVPAKATARNDNRSRPD